MPKLTHVEAAVLAGGRSSRMGRDKASLLLDGRSLAAHVAAALSPCIDRVRIVLHDDEAPPGDLELETLRDSELFARELAGCARVRAPMIGIATALARADAPWVFVAACDLPHLTPEVVLTLLALAATESSYAAIVPRRPDGPRGPEQPEPLLAIYRATQLEPLLARIRAGELALKHWLDECSTLWVPVDDLAAVDPRLECLRNLNRPEDLLPRSAVTVPRCAPELLRKDPPS